MKRNHKYIESDKLILETCTINQNIINGEHELLHNFVIKMLFYPYVFLFTQELLWIVPYREIVMRVYFIR